MHDEGEAVHIRRAIHAGLKDLEQTHRQLLDAKTQVERATHVLQSVTRASASEAPGRALINLHKAQDEIDQALSSLNASATAAEQWAARL